MKEMMQDEFLWSVYHERTPGARISLESASRMKEILGHKFLQSMRDEGVPGAGIP